MDWIHFYVDDWLAHTAHLSPADTGAYINVFCHFMCRDGHVPDDDRVLARVAKLDVRAWKKTKQRLIQASFIEIVDGLVQGVRLSKALAKGLAGSQLQSSRAAKGWDTRRVKSLNGQYPLHAAAVPRQCPSILPPLPSITITKERSAFAPIDSTAEVFGSPLHFLISSGSNERQARGLLGRWRKQHGDAVVLDTIAEAQRQSVSEPVAWITKALQARTGARPDDGWL
jgi:uncharacterized protein YdaU (DUF1376 family)